MTRQLVLWRHGRTSWNAEGRAQGQCDVPLDEVGQEQARSAAARLASLEPTAIVSSDLERAAKTAAELAALTGLEPTYDKRLREVSFGDREGLTDAESIARFPRQMDLWVASDEVGFPGGETYVETADRFAAALGDIVARMGADDLVVVASHGGAMRVGTCRFLGIPVELWTAFGGFANCSWAILRAGPRGWCIDEWNAGSLPEPVIGDDERETAARHSSGVRSVPDRVPAVERSDRS